MTAGGATSDELLEAFLRWDVGSLRKSGEAREVLRVFDLAPRHRFEVLTETSRIASLDLVAAGLGAELSGDPDTAMHAYRALARRRGLARVIGLSLVAWMTGPDGEAFLQLERATEALRPELAARVLAKLMTWSWEASDFEGARRYWHLALENAAGDGELYAALVQLTGWFTNEQVFTSRFFEDESITQPDVTDALRRSATKALVDDAIKSAESPWTRTWTFGAVPNHDAEIARIQTSWAGALWLMPEVYQHIGALLLRQHDGNADVLGQALGYWIRGRGKDAAKVVAASEQFFDADTLQPLLDLRGAVGPFLASDREWVALYVALWDELPTTEVDALIRDLELPALDPRVGDALYLENVNLFSVLYVRSPDQWRARFGQLTDEQVCSVVLSVGPGLADRLPSAVALRMLTCVLAVDASDTVTERLWIRGAGLAKAVHQNPAGQLVVEQFRDRVPASCAAEVQRIAGNVPPRLVLDQIRSLTSRVWADIEAQRRGSRGMSSIDPRTRLGMAVAAYGRRNPDAVAALVAAATDPPGGWQVRHAAAVGLSHIAEAGLLSKSSARNATTIVALREDYWDPSDLDDDPRLLGVEQELLRLRAGVQDASVTAFPLAAAAKDRSTRVRLAALHGALTSITEPNLVLQTAYIGALYDPAPEVQELGAYALQRGQIADPELQTLAVARLQQMWPHARRNVRVAIAQAATLRGIDSLREAAANDRSWLVRDAAGLLPT